MTELRRVGFLHPGAMGAAVGAAARAGGAEVTWASEGRSPATRQRAERAELTDVGDLDSLVATSQLILSICPPAAAVELAEAVASRGFGGWYLDANAVAPATVRQIGRVITEGGATFLDGGIVGPPPHEPGTTRMYLSGKGADTVAALFEGTPLQAVPLDGAPGAASALKVCFAAYTKGSTALLMAIRALAVAEDVDDDLLREWSLSQPKLAQRSEDAAQGALPKAWRFAGEMEQIAATFTAAGLPGGFHRAAGEVYLRLRQYKDTAEQVPFDDVLAALLNPPERG